MYNSIINHPYIVLCVHLPKVNWCSPASTLHTEVHPSGSSMSSEDEARATRTKGAAVEGKTKGYYLLEVRANGKFLVLYTCCPTPPSWCDRGALSSISTAETSLGNLDSQVAWPA